MPQDLEQVIGYQFKNSEYLKEALSHKSYASESQSPVYNERLEFLGDSILAAVIAHRLYSRYPEDREGSLSKKKSHLVSRASLAHWAGELGLGDHLYLGVGEDSSGGRRRQSVLGNALEALIGAIYLDGGYEEAARFIDQGLAERIGPQPEDFKSTLQEIMQKRHKTPPVYETTHVVGPDHDRTFSVAVRWGKKTLGEGVGKSKKEAEQAAARAALSAMEER